jgi:4-amino-4-deoxy-L-arabinose transferase-like glycosyltransferase
LDARALCLSGLLVLALTLWRLAALYTSDINLFFDEAQYWYWSTHPDFGYFSKPPVLAWLIWLSTAVFGESEFGIRALSPICYALTAALGGATAYRLSGAQAGAWTAVMLALLPGVSVSATIISTDVPLLLCWAAALYCYVRYAQQRGLWWIGLGIALGLGLLSKYAMIYFALGLAIMMLTAPSQRAMLARSGFWAALALGVVLFLPNVWWNWANDFVSFGHTAENANWQGFQLKFNKLGEFVGGQFGVFGPLLLIAFAWAVWRWRSLQEHERALAAFALPVLALMTLQSLLSRAHANWAAVAYVSATVFVVGWLVRHGRSSWLKLSLALHLLVAAAVLHGTSLAPLTGTDPWHRQRGWTALAADVRALLDQHPNAVLVAGDRKIAAQMMFYVRPHPWDMVKWNPDGHIGDHYELTSSMSSLAGRTAIFLTRGSSPAALAQYFTNITPLPSVARLRPTRPPEVYQVFLLDGYQGPE